MGEWFIGSFCTGLQGKEMLLIKLAGTANSLSHLGEAKNAHFIFVISGQTKSLGLSLESPAAWSLKGPI
jgi:hypothetical protein